MASGDGPKRIETEHADETQVGKPELDSGHRQTVNHHFPGIVGEELVTNSKNHHGDPAEEIQMQVDERRDSRPAKQTENPQEGTNKKVNNTGQDKLPAEAVGLL